MAKSFAESVKLPNLVAIQHPMTKFSAKCNLNVLGKNPNESSSSNFGSFNFDRKSYIASLLDKEEIRSRNSVNKINTTSDQVLDLINQKLNNGYYGVRHLFVSNDVHKNGRLSRESFKWILNQLCGFISNETWNKIIQKFKLDEYETISFDEFISYFDSNQKVKKEMLNKNLELLDFKSSSMSTLLSQRDLTKKIPLPELSATYCLSIIRSKAVKKDFDPKKYLPEECFLKNLVLPHHLQKLLNNLELRLSRKEFQKLWNKFDINDTGCCRTNIFLRLINYKSTEEDQNRFQLHKSKSIIVDKLELNNQFSGNYPTVPLNTFRSNKSFHAEENNQKIEETKLVNSMSDFQNEALDEVEEIDEEEIQNVQEAKEEKNEECPKNNFKSVNRTDTSLSEAKIKSMVSSLKKTNDFGPKNDLVSFLNNKLNEGLIVLRTAFEYIDQDRLGHLLVFEFRSVLEEFKFFTDAKLMTSFLKKHYLLKNDQIVDYVKFLNVFNDRSPHSLFKQPPNFGTEDQLEMQILHFLHENYETLFNFFKKSLEDSTCSVEQLRRLIEQRFSIIIDNNQFENLLDFLNVDGDSQRIQWEIMFRKFSEIDAWKLFKDSFDRSECKSRKSSSGSSRSSFNRSKSLLNFNPKPEPIVEINEKTILEQDSEKNSDLEFTSDDETLSSMLTFNNKKSFKKSKYSKISKNFQEQVKLIRALEKKVESNMRLQFHSINKHFSVLDKTHTEMIDREKFQNLMKKCGSNFTQNEVDLLWKDFDSESVPFSLLVRRFFVPEEFDNFRRIRHKIKLEKQINEEQSANGFAVGSFNNSFSYPQPKETEIKKRKKRAIIQKARPLILQHWEELKQQFRREDKLGKTSITLAKAYAILQSNQILANETDLHELCHKFHTNGIDFSYVKFLKYFKNGKTDANGLSEFNPLLINLITKLREKHLEHNKIKQPNENDISNLLLIFKKYDLAKKGFLTDKEFKSLLDNLGLKPSPDQMYLIMSEFDPDLRGNFHYERLVHSLIEKMLI